MTDTPQEVVPPRQITPAAPDEFGLVQVWWGEGKGKTTAAMGMGLRAVGHGYRVHMLQFMKGGAASVEDVRGEYNAIAATPGFSYENRGHYGWHVPGDDEPDHAAQAQAGLERAQELAAAASDAGTTALAPDASPDQGCHMLILDEILYAANRRLIEPEAVVELAATKPAELELVCTGGHQEPTYVLSQADLVSHIEKQHHPIEEGQTARKGTEY
ncbi:MAG: ATP:corrinoid adenosyltransferase [halophilic archaeon J07HX5]|jgi:cob(I)yrinic acid a,c-diamide adenosyltransferase (EC 2.5.1.17)|nr:MAG: ATP:corrinoid adenosyltransferase [halophilic archaeon J07HX5]